MPKPLARGNEGGRGRDEDREGARAETGRGGDASLNTRALVSFSHRRDRVVKSFLGSGFVADALRIACVHFLVVRADFTHVVRIGAGGADQRIGARGYFFQFLRTTGAICQGCTRRSESRSRRTRTESHAVVNREEVEERGIHMKDNRRHGPTARRAPRTVLRASCMLRLRVPGSRERDC